MEKMLFFIPKHTKKENSQQNGICPQKSMKNVKRIFQAENKNNKSIITLHCDLKIENFFFVGYFSFFFQCYKLRFNGLYF